MKINGCKTHVYAKARCTFYPTDFSASIGIMQIKKQVGTFQFPILHDCMK